MHRSRLMAMLGVLLTPTLVSCGETTRIKELAEWRGPVGSVNCIKFTFDGTEAVSGGQDGVRLWNVSRGEVLAHFQPNVKERGQIANEVRGIAIVGDKPQAIVGGWWPYAFTWDYETNAVGAKAELPAIDGNVGVVNAVSVATDQQQAAIVVNFLRPKVSEESFRALIVELPALKPIRWLTGHSSPILDVAFSSDGKAIATITEHTLQLWEVESGRQLKSEGEPSRSDSFSTISKGSVAFDDSGRFVLRAQKDASTRFEIWDVENWDRRLTFPLERNVRTTCAVFVPGGERVVSAHTDGSIRLWKTSTATMLTKVDAFNTGAPAFALAVSPDRKFLLSAGDGAVSNVLTRQDRTRIRLWQLPD